MRPPVTACGRRRPGWCAVLRAALCATLGGALLTAATWAFIGWLAVLPLGLAFCFGFACAAIYDEWEVEQIAAEEEAGD